MKTFIVSLHDVAPSKAELCRRWVEVLSDRNIRATLLVVPGKWNGVSLSESPQFVSWLHAVQGEGHEVALHGLHHSKDPSFKTTAFRSIIGSVLARGCEEFWHLPYSEAKARLHSGLEVMSQNGFQPKGFVAPGWLMSPESYEALRDIDLQYTTTHTEVIHLKTHQRIKMVSLSQRPQSIFTKPGIALNLSAVKLAIRMNAPLRIAIHPNDAVNPKVRKTNIEIIDSLVSAGYRHSTYEEFVTEWSRSIQKLEVSPPFKKHLD